MHVASLDQTNVCLRQGHSQELLGELEFRMVFLVYCPGQNVFKIALWALTGAGCITGSLLSCPHVEV